MSNNIRIRKNKLKGTGILAAAALGEYCVFSDSGQHHA